MREKHTKLIFLRNFRMHGNDFKNNDVKIIVTTLAPRSAIFYVAATNPKDVQERKTI